MIEPSVKSIHMVAEHRLNKYRLLAMRERDADDLRAGELLEKADEDLWRAAEKYMERGGSPDRARDIVHRVISSYIIGAPKRD